MKLFCFPYRWLPRTIWTNITHPYYDIKNGVRNLYIFFEAVWWFRSWDWTGMVELLQVSAREMRKAQKYSYHLNADRDARQLLIVETLCKRMREDRYFENAGYDDGWRSKPEHERSRIAKHAGYMEYQDSVYLGRMLRLVRHWWA